MGIVVGKTGAHKIQRARMGTCQVERVTGDNSSCQPIIDRCSCVTDGGTVPYKDAAKDRAAHAARNRRLWAATPQWKRTEGLVAVMLRRRGVQCRRVGKVRSPFDVLTAGGLRCEVKAASFRRNRKAWVVSIQRQGKLDESQVDFYVLALSVGGLFHRAKHKKVYLVIESPIRR